MPVSSEKRRDRILAEVLERKHVTARDLAAHMEVSEATVRRDLRALADGGRLELVYGGATLGRHGEFSFIAKGQRNVEAKRVIGELAAGLVGDDEQVFLDSGTTCFEMAAFLRKKRRLSVIGNSARLALELDAPGLSVILLGGQYRPDRMDSVGPLAMATLDKLRGFVAFIGADGISMEFGPAAVDIESAHINGLAARHAREAVLLVDHSKFQTPSLFRIETWDAISRVVTDREPGDAWKEFFEQRGIGVVWPGEEDETRRH